MEGMGVALWREWEWPGRVAQAHSLSTSIAVFLRPQRNLESIDPQFTIRRKMEQMREEKELVEQLREVLGNDKCLSTMLGIQAALCAGQPGLEALHVIPVLVLQFLIQT